MNPFEMLANGTRLVYNEGYSQPEPLNSVPILPSILPNSGQLYSNNVDIAEALNLAMYNGRDESNNFGGEAPEFTEHLENLWSLTELDEHYSCHSTDVYINDSPMETEQDGSALLASLFDESVESPETFTCGPVTARTSLEQGAEADGLNLDQFEEQVFSWSPPQLALPTDMFKGVTKRKNSEKYASEIRIAKKIQKESKYPKSKLWLGTYGTPAQAARALDVGKYFLNAKKKRTFSDPKSESILSTIKDRVLARPLSELMENVKKIAKHYGENGTLPHTLVNIL